jgi:hypothetical protein
MSYDPNIETHRQILAVELLTRLDTAGFTRESVQPGTKELVFSRPHNKSGIRVVVYTTIIEQRGIPQVREHGADAIRACALYTTRDGNTRPVAKADHRVFRTGEIPAIADRTIQRLRDVWKAVGTSGCCKGCGAPLFTSKKGNDVCAELCFMK